MVVGSKQCVCEKQLFCKLWIAGLACSGLQMCCFVGGVSSFFVRGEKNKINFHQTAPTYQRSTNPVNLFFVITSILFYRVNVSSWWFSTLAYNGHVVE
jgi:hypothetical protein